MTAEAALLGQQRIPSADLEPDIPTANVNVGVVVADHIRLCREFPVSTPMSTIRLSPNRRPPDQQLGTPSMAAHGSMAGPAHRWLGMQTKAGWNGIPPR